MTIPMAYEIEVAGIHAADLTPRILIRVMLPDGVSTFGMTREEAVCLSELLASASENFR